MTIESDMQLSGDPKATSRWIPLGTVSQPGTYVAKETGDLIRIPPDGDSESDKDMFDKDAQEEMLVIKVSDDPFIPITKARLAAAAMDVEISF